MRHLVKLLFPLLATVLAGCAKIDLGYRVTDNSTQAVTVIFYAEAFNNLSSDIKANIETTFKGSVPQKGSKKNLVVYAHCAKGDADATPVNGYLVKATRGEYGVLDLDTLLVVPAGESSVDPAVMRKVLNTALEKAPAKEYGLILSSHGSGWLPQNYERFGDRALTRSIGAEGYFGRSGDDVAEMDIKTLAGAIPMHLSWMIFDACFMGCIEVAYELRDLVDKIGFSPTEILSYGFDYTSLAPYLLADGGSIERYCDSFYHRYADGGMGSGQMQSATITTVDCSQLDALSELCATLFEKYRVPISRLRASDGIQRCYRPSTDNYRYLFDMEDILVHAGINAAEKLALEDALSKCITYKANTPYFLELPIDTYCGLSMYLPGSGTTLLSNYYKSLSWNASTALVE